MKKITKVLIFGSVSILLVAGGFLVTFDKCPFLRKMGASHVAKVLNEAKQKRVPAIFFIYSNREEKRDWKKLVDEKEVSQQLDGFLYKIVPVSSFSELYTDLFKDDAAVALLAVDFKGEKRFFEQRFLSSTELLDILDEMLVLNNKMLEREHIAKKESIKIRKTFKSQQYLSAMRQCRKFLSIYSNTEVSSEIRALLNECGDKPEVVKHLENNRDRANRKVLLHSAEEALEYKRYFNFLRIVAMLNQKYPGTEEAETAKKLKTKMETESREKFKKANNLYVAKKFALAMEAYEAMHRDYKGTHWDLFIAGKIQQMMSDPQYQKYLKQVELNHQAKVVFKQAEKHFETKRYDLALKFYHEIIKLYSKSKYIVRAKQRIQEIENIEKVSPVN